MFNYQKICQELLKDLPERQKEVIWRRFGLKSKNLETLESIGKDFGITRERVRQIQNEGFLRLRPKLEKYQEVFQDFIWQLKANGDLKKEKLLLNHLGGQKFQNQIFFLLTISPSFFRFPETEDYYSFWTVNPNSLNFAQKVIRAFINILSQRKQPLAIEELSHSQIFKRDLEKATLNRLSSQAFQSFLEISKKIQANQEGLFGLRDWPEINPRGIKDKAYLVFKKEKRPLHFREVAKLIGPEALPQTVHNELIKDFRFVLVGRGIYALREWGYQEGQVKDIILKILKAAKKPLSKEEILSRVLKQRMVKESTVLLNLRNKRYFLKNSQGKYFIGKR